MQSQWIKSGGSGGLQLSELWQYRDLLWVLALRDLRVRYAQTVLGVAWAILQPAGTLLILTVVFGVAAKIDTGALPYPVFALTGLLFWSYFAQVMSQAGSSIIGASGMISKIYFPRLIIPVSRSLTPLPEVIVGLVFLTVLMGYYGVLPSQRLVVLPLVFLWCIGTALAVGIWLSALTVRFRDFQHIIPFMVQFGLYATPVAYPASLLPSKWNWLYFINPMAGICEAARWSVLGIGTPTVEWVYSLSVTLVLFVSGLFYFKKVEALMADLL